ncbi:DUF3558 domain-containing protein [Nocardia sp. NPDC059180]|uniref:DUF3558 domain-containing protein n=1 Tax=Nocardia sp. NPDC059180 TaxID=3346761 RepID=UPI003692B685
MGRRKTAVVAVLAGALLAAAGCGSANEGTATPTATTDQAAAEEALWDPCQISDDVLVRIGVDPSTEDNTIAGVENVEGWELCSWKDKPTRSNYTVGAWSTTHSLEDIKSDSNNIEYEELSVAGRTGIQFRKSHDEDKSECYIAFPSGAQTLEVSAYKSTLTEDVRDSCEIALSAAEALVPIFPS